MFVIKKPSRKTFDRVGHTGTIFPTQNLTNKTQFLFIETETGLQTIIREKECDFSYYILEGKGYFIIDGMKEECTKGDLVVIPAGKAFSFKGNLKMLLNVTPVFTPEQEETIETNKK